MGGKKDFDGPPPQGIICNIPLGMVHGCLRSVSSSSNERRQQMQAQQLLIDRKRIGVSFTENQYSFVASELFFGAKISK